MKKKKTPMRTCSGCNEKKEKSELVRIVRSPDGEISLDLTGKKSGRGAYLCNNPQCLEKAKKAKRLERSLSLKIPDEVYDNLEEGLKLGKR